MVRVNDLLIDERWELAAIAAVRRTREQEPQEWADHLREAEEWPSVEAPVVDEWNSR